MQLLVAQHLLLGSVCSLTHFMNHLLSGKAPSRLAPWLCGAPLAALVKNGGGIWPIAVGEVLHRLASCLCCLAVYRYLPSVFFLPYGQVGVDIPGGLESAIHIVHRFISVHSADDSFALLKVDRKNVFNECDHSAFFTFVIEDFPDISAWVKWCYSQLAELHFGNRRLLASSGCNRMILWALCFLRVILQFIDAVKLHDLIELNIWYFDDGTLVGKQSSLLSLLSLFATCPEFVLHLTLSKCELFGHLEIFFPISHLT